MSCWVDRMITKGNGWVDGLAIKGERDKEGCNGQWVGWFAMASEMGIYCELQVVNCFKSL